MESTDSFTPLSWHLVSFLSLGVLMLPLASFLINSFLPEKFRSSISWFGTFLVGLSVICALIALNQVFDGAVHSREVWFEIGEHAVTAGILINLEAALMLVVVTVISFLVHLYSIQYMKSDDGFKRYFAFLGLFTFSMVGIVIADNLLLIFVFWELVGLSSYLLIGHWFKKKSAAFAASKAFIVNRIGDAGFLIGLAILWTQFGTLDLEALQSLVAESSVSEGIWTFGDHELNEIWITGAGICLFLGAVGKSAQFPLQVWLPDAMEGPTPVSALIHAATMVAAGVYLMIRVFVFLDIDALTIIAYTGAITAFMGAVAALIQNDIKRVLAYSTISQLGYMIMGIGVGAYDAAFFHLFTHAFFKACLFLAAGSVIYALHKYSHDNKVEFDAQDMRNMGGLRKRMPITFAAYLIAALALIGIPFFSGFLSKEALLSGAFAWAKTMGGDGFSWHYLVPDLGFITVVLTAIYMVRQLLLVFFGDFRIEAGQKEREVVTESPMLMRLTLVVLAVLSLGIVWSLNPFNFQNSWFLAMINVPQLVMPGINPDFQFSLIELSLVNHLTVTIISITMIIIGAAISWYYYRPTGSYDRSYLTKPMALSMVQKVSYYNWFLDPIYHTVIQKPVIWLAGISNQIDKKIIDRAIDLFGIGNVILAHCAGWFDRAIIDGAVNLMAYISGAIGKVAGSIQGGRIQNYMVLAILGVILLILWII